MQIAYATVAVQEKEQKLIGFLLINLSSNVLLVQVTIHQYLLLMMTTMMLLLMTKVRIIDYYIHRVHVSLIDFSFIYCSSSSCFLFFTFDIFASVVVLLL